MLPRKFRKPLALLAAALLGTSGLYATFTDQVSTEPQHLNSAQGALELYDGSLLATATSSVSDLVPGDSVTRDVRIRNAASYDLAAISLSITDSVSGTPFTSHPEGLKLLIQRFNGSGWTSIYGPGAPTGAVMADIGGPAKEAEGEDWLRFIQVFVGPDESQELKGAEANLTYTFVGTQRDGEGGPQAGLTYNSAAVMGDSPSALWAFDESTGATQLADASGNAHVVSLNSAFESVPGLLSGSGTAGKLTSGSGSSSISSPESLYSSSGMTVEAVIDVVNTSSWYRIIGNQYAGHGGDFTFGIASGAVWFGTDGASQYIMSDDQLTVGVHHVAATYAGDTVKLYVDGQLVKTVTGAPALDANDHSNLQIGGNGDGSGLRYPDAIDQLAIYPVALSDAQIAAHVAG